VWMTAIVVAIPAGAAPGPADRQREGAVLLERFRRLTRASEWRLVRTLTPDFDAHHTQGLARVGDHLWLSAVEVIDRPQGRGQGYLFELDHTGRLLRTLRLGEGSRYHPGGIDFDGALLWVPVSEYRPESSARIYGVDPTTGSVRTSFDWPDHVGAILCGRGRRVGFTWGGRRSVSWAARGDGDAGARPAPSGRVHINGNHYVDYQDGQGVGSDRWGILGGLAEIRGPGDVRVPLGGLELIDLRSMKPAHQVPVPLWTPDGRSVLQNAFHVEPAGGGLRFWFAPGDGRASIFVYDVR
jgi:Family of unknown function (DUF6454)